MSDAHLETVIKQHWLDDQPQLRRWCWIILILIAVGTCIAMFIPFISIDKPLSRPKYFSIIQTVSLLWGKGLYILAIIIAGFSIIFPFLKLAVMGRALYLDSVSHTWLQRLHLAGRLGKWSMIDVFIVSLLLALGERQLLLKVTTHFGLYLFTACILGSIGLGIVLSTLVHRRQQTAGHQNEEDFGKGHDRLSLSMLGISSLAFVGLCLFPFLEIDDWRLRDRDFTLLTFIAAVWNQGGHLLAVYFALALVALPICEMTALWLLLSKQFSSSLLHGRLAPLFSLMRHWSILDVFLVALLIFVIEGDQFVKFHINIGFWLLAVSLIAYISRYSIRYRLSRARRHNSQVDNDADNNPDETEDHERLQQSDAAVD